MSAIDLARDVLNQYESPDSSFTEKQNALCCLQGSGPQYAAAAVRAAALAQELRSRGERLGKSTYAHERAEGSGYTAASAQLMAALEGGAQ